MAFLVIAACFGIYMAGVSIDNLIEINGAVIGFFFIYFLPALLHVKCLYFCCNKDENMVREPLNNPNQKEIELRTIEGPSNPYK